MSQQQSRSIWAMIIRNFINSLKPRQLSGDFKGVDHFGNKYYEISANNSRSNKRSRWFEPASEDDFEAEKSPEWESWLRGRRKDPPTKEEIMANIALMKSKQAKAIVIDAQGGTKTPMKKGMESFPSRPEYELFPGKHRKTPR